MLQLIVSGLAVGALYALFTCGYALTLRLGINNFSQGALAVFGGWMAHLGLGLHIPLAWAISLGALASALLCAGIYRVAIAPLLSQQRWSTIFVSTFAVALVIENVILLLNGPENFAIRQPFHLSEMIVFASVRITQVQAVLMLGSFGMLAVVAATLRWTPLGSRIRMTAEDRELAELHGVNTNRTVTITFMLSGLLAGTAGGLLALDYDLHAFSGTMLLLKGYLVALVVGEGLAAVMLAAYGMGICEVFTARYLSSQSTQAVLFAIITFLLFVRRGAIFASPVRTL